MPISLEGNRMNFLKDDEFIIFMAHNAQRTSDSGDTYRVHTLEERSRMREAGIQTAHEQPAWNILEPSRGSYNFAYLDNIISLNREAGMKSLVQIAGWRIPTWIPHEWKAKRKDGVVETEVLSMWNDEAQEYSDAFYERMINEYKNQKDVMFFFGEYQGGEGAYPPTWCLYDDAALENYKRIYGASAEPKPGDPETLGWFGGMIVDHFIRKAYYFHTAYNEIWNEQQYLMDTWTKAFGNFRQADTLELFHRVWPESNIVLLQYTYFDSSHNDACKEFVDKLVKASECEVIVEAMFYSGLPTTTPQAIAKGFRGQILHPTKESFSGEALCDEAINNIKNSHKMWMESREFE